MDYRQHKIKIFLSLMIINLWAFNAGAQVEQARSGGHLQLKFSDKQVTAPMLTTDVVMDISGLTARVKVTQTFENNSAEWVEGLYFFPLPEKSAVDHLLMKIGERVIEGEIHEKQKAKKIYQQAKISGKKASLVEQHRPNVFSNSVANIGPHEMIQITIEYQQDLAYQRDTGMSIVFPMTMTERYTPQAMLVENYMDLADGIQTAPSSYEEVKIPQTPADEETNQVTMLVRLNAGFPLAFLQSSSHQITVKDIDSKEKSIILSEGSVLADRDFILNWMPIAEEQPRVALFSESKSVATNSNQSESIETQQVKDNQAQYISLMVMPPSQAAHFSVLPREVIFVLDTSGSMAGESIKQAKQALLHGLNTLVKGDRFNIIEFNSDTSMLFAKAQIYDESSRHNAIQFVNRLDANGGTEMLKAMNVALNGSSHEQTLRQVIFLTDGAINNEAQLFGKITADLGDSRLFTVGIGSAPNEFFMKRAAQFGRGTATFIANIQQTESKIRALFDQISSPVLSHINIKWPKGLDVEMWPARVPDLFAGEPLWIKAKIKNSSNQAPLATVEISGRLTNSLWQTKLPLSAGKNQAGISQLWAREKIAAVMNEAKHGQLNEIQRQLVTQTALEHHLVSRFTSLVAVDKTPQRAGQTLHEKILPQTAPKGSLPNTLSYPKTALNFNIGFSSALISLLAGLMLWLVSFKHR